MSFFDRKEIPPQLGPDGNIESTYDRGMRLFKEYEEIFREYLREYLVSQEIDHTILQRIEANPKDERRLIQEIAARLSQITNNTISATFLADRCSAMISIMLSSIALEAAIDDRQPDHVVRRKNTQQAIVEAAWDVYDPTATDLRTLRMGRDKAQEARDLLHAEHDLNDPWKNSGLHGRERDEELAVALQYLELQTPSLAERLRELTQESLYEFLRQGQGIFATDEQGDADIRLEWERSRHNPDIKEAYRTILDHTITNKLHALEQAAKSYLFGDRNENDPLSLRAKRDDLVALQEEASEEQIQAITIALEVMKAHTLLSALDARNRGQPTYECALELLDGEEVHRLALMRSVNNLAEIAMRALERLSYAETRPDMDPELAARFHVPSMQKTIEQSQFAHVSDPEVRTQAARAATLARIQAKKTLYNQIISMCTLAKNNGVATRQKTDLRRLIDEVIQPFATKLIAQAKIPIEQRIMTKQEAYQYQLVDFIRTKRATQDTAELTAHTPREIATLANILQRDLVSRLHPKRWSVDIIKRMQGLMQMAENKARSLENGTYPDPDGSKMQRARSYPALAWKDKIKDDGHPV